MHLENITWKVALLTIEQNEKYKNIHLIYILFLILPEFSLSNTKRQ